MGKISKNQELINNYSSLDLLVLPEEIKKNGFIYKLIKREPHKCIYVQTKNGQERTYEVFTTKIVNHRERMIAMKNNLGQNINYEKLNEYKEVFPGDEEFGRRAWNYKLKKDALKAYDEL